MTSDVVSGKKGVNKRMKPSAGGYPDLERPVRTLWGDINNPPRFSLNSLLMIVCGAVFIAMLGFVVVPLPDPYAAVFEREEWFLYSFQLPFVLFWGMLMGSRLGIASLVLFALTAMFWFPLFAGGGGLDYFLQPGMGYYLGMIGGILAGERWVPKSLNKPNRSGRSLVLLLGAAIAVVTAHVIGTLYLLFVNVVSGFDLNTFYHWWIQYSGAPLVYDICSAMTMFCMIRYTRLGLWLALY